MATPKRMWPTDLKHIVRYTSRRTSSRYRVPPGQKANPKLAPKVHAAASTPSTNTSHSTETTPPSDNGFYDTAESPLSPNGAQHLTIATIPAEDSILLMHFLDKVFPLQYPMYRPDILEGGRGWLLALLLQTKSLYHAALALSSYHRRMLVFERISEQCRATAAVQQEKHLETCLNEVRQAMVILDQRTRQRKSYDGMGTVTSIVQLVFFELFAGQDHAWRTHLNAAIDVYDQNCRDKLEHLDLSEASKTILRNDQRLAVDGALVTQEVTTFRFMGGSIIWLDILSSLAAGSVPRLLSYHQGVLDAASQVKLENIMGCKNWLMCQIGRIAALQGHRRQDGWTSQRHGIKLHSIAADIKSEIESGMAREALESLNIQTSDSCGINNSSTNSVTLTTRMFAFMAIIHLHLVTHDFERLDNLRETIADAIRLLQSQVPCSMIPVIVAPLFIIGCVAAQGDEQSLFRASLASDTSQHRLYRHRKDVLSALEEIWSKRQTSTDYTWNDVLDMGQHKYLLFL
nr:PtaR3 [Pestalotiopsis fici]